MYNVSVLQIYIDNGINPLLDPVPELIHYTGLATLDFSMCDDKKKIRENLRNSNTCSHLPL
jgi:hypothetical protein